MTQVFSMVKCTFQPTVQKRYFRKSEVDVIYAESENLDYSMLRKYVSSEELERSEQFHFADDRRTYICCHAILRLMLARRLNNDPLGIYFEKGKYRKPYLLHSPVGFNVSHTRRAFTIVISDTYIGVDVENLNKLAEPRQIMKIFSASEQSFITENLQEEKERMILLWTRKEALLKAIGSGIINDLNKINVSEPHNLLPTSISRIQDDTMSGEHFIYSTRISDDFLSIATPVEADLRLKIIDDCNFISTMSYLLNFSRNHLVPDI